eukprot:12749790-Ditylum_brightwellii.AAC.1
MEESNTKPNNKSQKLVKFAAQAKTKSSLAQAAQSLAGVQKKAAKPVLKLYARAKDNSSNKTDNNNVNR